MSLKAIFVSAQKHMAFARPDNRGYISSVVGTGEGHVLLSGDLFFSKKIRKSSPP